MRILVLVLVLVLAVLSFPICADAGIVWSGIVNQEMEESRAYVDFDGDGTDEVTFCCSYFPPDFLALNYWTESADGVSTDSSHADKLPEQCMICSTSSFSSSPLLFYNEDDPYGWLNSTNGLLGFVLYKDDILYAWVRINVDSTGHVTIVEYAYESEADTGIPAGARGITAPPQAVFSQVGVSGNLLGFAITNFSGTITGSVQKATDLVSTEWVPAMVFTSAPGEGINLPIGGSDTVGVYRVTIP